MGQILLAGNPPIEITLRKSARARRLSLRVSRLDGRVTLSHPSWTAQSEAIAFAQEKESWIRRNLASTVEISVLEIGGAVMFEGAETPLVSGKTRSVQFSDGQIHVPGSADKAATKVATYFKVLARQRLDLASRTYADTLGVGFGRISIRDTRSRWGSCTTDGNLMFSWRLIMAPPEILDYVAAHEVSHLVEMNHSAAYWDVVKSIFPEYKPARKWLRVHGQRLHAYRFGN